MFQIFFKCQASTEITLDEFLDLALRNKLKNKDFKLIKIDIKKIINNSTIDQAKNEYIKDFDSLFKKICNKIESLKNKDLYKLYPSFKYSGEITLDNKMYKNIVKQIPQDKNTPLYQEISEFLQCFSKFKIIELSSLLEKKTVEMFIQSFTNGKNFIYYETKLKDILPILQNIFINKTTNLTENEEFKIMYILLFLHNNMLYNFNYQLLLNTVYIILKQDKKHENFLIEFFDGIKEMALIIIKSSFTKDEIADLLDHIKFTYYCYITISKNIDQYFKNLSYQDKFIIKLYILCDINRHNIVIN